MEAAQNDLMIWVYCSKTFADSIAHFKEDN